MKSTQCGTMIARYFWVFTRSILLVPFLFLLISLPTQAQRIATLVLQDARGWRDTVYFGQENGATPGIDPALGEVEISSIPMLGTEMRFVSRAPRSCFYDSMLTYRQHNYETKKDVRGVLNGSRYWRYAQINFGLTTQEMEEHMFHLKIKCSALPCTLNAVAGSPFSSRGNNINNTIVAGSQWESSCRSLGNFSWNSVIDYSFFPGFILEISSHFQSKIQLYS